jgi:hypothetical protein
MVEGYGETHVILYTPPSHFDAAVILRTLYTGLGVNVAWKLHIIGLGRRLRPKLISDSRVPVRIALERLSLEEPDYSGGCVFVVDSRGKPVWQVEEKPSFIVVDYTSTSFNEARVEACVERVSALGLPIPTYEAVAVIYATLIRPLYLTPRGSLDTFYTDARKAVYLARKLVEAMKTFDNYLLFEPNTIVYVLRKVYVEEGYILDPERYSITISPADGVVAEAITMAAYDRRMKLRGRVEVEIGRDSIVVRDWRGVRFKFHIDRLRRLICVEEGGCVSPRDTGEPQLPSSSSFFTIS